jgi:hypothetical protein
MAELTKHGTTVHTVFDLLGRKENDLSFSLGWALQQCPRFLSALVEHFTGAPLLPAEHSVATVRLQQHDQAKGGYTDVEIDIPGRCYIVLELKLGWNLPTLDQLNRYTRRAGFNDPIYPTKALVTLSECSAVYANYHLPVVNFAAAPLVHLNWQQIIQLVRAGRPGSSHAAKQVLDQFVTYLNSATSMRRVDSNWVYVVSLSDTELVGWDMTFMEVVLERNRYFHPVGNNWPTEAVNYIAFRYGGRLRSIHHVDSFIVTDDPAQEFPEAQGTRFDVPHFIYHLGPAIPLPTQIPTGPGIHRATRVRCMLDTLLTCTSITEAMEVSQAREEAMEQ